MYSMGVATIAEQLKCDRDKAQNILDTFFNSFPKVKEWLNYTNTFAKKNGFVEDYSGRKRRLPELFLDKYEVFDGKKKQDTFNPLLFCNGIITAQVNPIVDKYKKSLASAKYRKDVDAIKSQAEKDKITIIDNGNKIAKAERQCVNARIQGGAATLTKLAMIKIYNDEVMKKYGAKLIINVHDELLVECDEKYAQECADRLAYDMCQAAIDVGIDIPMKCDAEVFRWWYQDQIIGDIKKLIAGDAEKNIPPRPQEDVLNEYSEFLTQDMMQTIIPLL